MSEQRIYPSREELRVSPRPLNDGEWAVLDFFDDRLSAEWKIFVEPHLNGSRPDFILLHPQNGIAVFEVKDWDLDAVAYSYEGDPLRLIGRPRAGGRWSPEREPITQVKVYKDLICNLYCPSLEDAGSKGFGVVTAGVIFPKASTSQLSELFGDETRDELGFKSSYKQNVIAGKDDLTAEGLLRVFPNVHRVHPKMSQAIFDELLAWLVYPEFAAEQGRPLELDARQKELVKSRTEKTGYRRVKGPAGSGKSLVLAARAAQLVKDGTRNILVVTYNITLKNYLADLAVRWYRPGVRSAIEWWNYHRWAKKMCISAGYKREYGRLWPESDDEDLKRMVLNERLPELVESLVRQNPEMKKYDAILVDEGQDFRLSWWNSLRAALREGGEMLLVADYTQDLYGTATAWTDEAMKGAGFRGPWVVLERNHRLPRAMIPHVQRFAEEFLPRGTSLPPEVEQGELDLSSLKLRWVQLGEESPANAMERAVLEMPLGAGPGGLAWMDIVFLTFSNGLGRQVVELLEGRGFEVMHTFDAGTPGERARRKAAFFKGRECLKATTVHSFKGWEGHALVIHIPKGVHEDQQQLAAVYVALTRLKQSPNGAFLTVVCEEPTFASYGRTWSGFEQWPKEEVETVPAELLSFEAPWRPLVAELRAMPGVRVSNDPDGRAVGIVRKGKCALFLVDTTQHDEGRLAERLEAQGREAFEIDLDPRSLTRMAQKIVEDLDMLSDQ